MGLDITAYKKLTIVPGAAINGDGEPEDDTLWTPGASMEWSEGHWPGRAAGIPDAKAVYSYTDSFCFHAGSYGGYNVFRSELESFARGAGPFAELIEFADNEGVIGPVVSQKLAADFAKYQDAWDAAHTGDA
jgi:hypothetical protein